MNKSQLQARIIFTNGIVDIAMGTLLMFLNAWLVAIIGLPPFSDGEKYFMLGMGVQIFSFGIARIWGAFRPELHRYTMAMGVVEGGLVAITTLAYILITNLTLIQGALPLAIGLFFGTTYCCLLLGQKK